MSFLNGVSEALTAESGYIDAIKNGVDAASDREKVLAGVAIGLVAGAAITVGVVKLQHVRAKRKAEKQLENVVQSVIDGLGRGEIPVALRNVLKPSVAA